MMMTVLLDADNFFLLLFFFNLKIKYRDVFFVFFAENYYSLLKKEIKILSYISYNLLPIRGFFFWGGAYFLIRSDRVREDAAKAAGPKIFFASRSLQKRGGLLVLFLSFYILAYLAYNFL